MISITDVGITISNGQGATITMTGPSVTINAGRAGGDLSGREGRHARLSVAAWARR